MWKICLFLRHFKTKINEDMWFFFGPYLTMPLFTFFLVTLPLLPWLLFSVSLVEATTTSWIAVGWRPDDLSIACQKFPRETKPPRGVDMHAMDCTDMVIGMARDGRGFVADYYTRDRSTPRRDAFWVSSKIIIINFNLIYKKNYTLMVHRYWHVGIKSLF